MKLPESNAFARFNIPFFHIGYWIFFIIIITTVRSSALEQYLLHDVLYSVLADLPFLVLLTYLLTELLIPWYLKAEIKYLPAISIILLILALNPAIFYLTRVYFVKPFIIADISPYDLGIYLEDVIFYIFISGPVAGFKVARLIRAEMVHHRMVETDKLQAEIKLREAELQLLKGQIQPHFLFNTLNNLYSLAIDRSDKVPDLILKLNSLLSYVVYECNSEKVSMVKELEFIRSFIELQRLRFDTDSIDLEIEGDPGDLKIGPMILQTFIDNSIKHGKKGDGINPWIKIYLGIKGRVLYFKSTNLKDNAKINNNGGIGLSNVLKRLELLYPGRYNIDIDDGKEFYTISLSIQL